MNIFDKFLTNNKTMVHLDLSYNYFVYEDC